MKKSKDCWITDIDIFKKYCMDGNLFGIRSMFHKLEWGNTESRLIFRINQKNPPCIYLLFNDDGELIYIGQSQNLLKRISTHKRDKDFCISYFAFTDKPDELERLLIYSFETKYNKCHNTKFTNKKPNSDYIIKKEYLKDWRESINNVIFKIVLDENFDTNIVRELKLVKDEIDSFIVAKEINEI